MGLPKSPSLIPVARHSERAGARLREALSGEAEDLAEVGAKMVALANAMVERFRQQVELISSTMTRSSARAEEVGKGLRDEAEALGRLAANLSDDIAQVKGVASEAGAALSRDLAAIAVRADEFLESYRGEVPVLEDGRLVGILSIEDVKGVT